MAEAIGEGEGEGKTHAPRWVRTQNAPDASKNLRRHLQHDVFSQLGAEFFGELVVRELLGEPGEGIRASTCIG